MPDRGRIAVALAGNPNSGKTTLFNAITGARQHVGNYPGVTVEKKEGYRHHQGVDIHVVDLPGTYSLTAYSIDEVVARDFVVNDRPDVVVHIIDASNLERNLYLTLELLDLGAPLVLAFNMADVAVARGIEFDLEKLSAFFGAPIVQTVGHRGEGISALLDAVLAVARGEWADRHAHVTYGREVEAELHRLVELVTGSSPFTDRYGARWVAIKLLERDDDVRRRLTDPELLRAADQAGERIRRHFGDPPEIVLADQRYGFISGACQEAVRLTVESRHRFSDRVDAVLTHRLLGIPLFLVMMYLVFELTFAIGALPMGWLEMGFGWLGEWLTTLWPRGSESVLKSLLIDGVIGGVGGVVAFLPNILLLFLGIAILEDSGYMARAAFIMDHLMHKIGLHGKSFIPMLIGFGCSVPAILATRTLRNPRDRLTTMLVVPLMSCGARLTIYALIIPAFFPEAWRGPMLWLIYVIGIVLAILSAKLLRLTVFRGESEPFVMELPPYRIPTLRGCLLHMWERSWLYLRKAGTIILAVSIVLWAMTSYPKKEAFDQDYGALAADAEAKYMQGVREAAARLGPAGGLLQEAAEAELAMQAEQAEWHPRQGGFATARARYEATLVKLKAAEGGDVLARFLEFRDAVVESRSRFHAVVRAERLGRESPDYAVVLARRDAALHRLHDQDPTVFDAVVRYLDQARAPFEEMLGRLENQRRAEELAWSVAGRIGRGLEPVLEPLGFDWKIGTALIGAFAAKEVFVAQLGIVYSLGETGEGSESLRAVLRANYSPLVGFCIMLFSLIATPCVATLAVTRRESGSWKWAAFQTGGLTLIAYVLTLVVYQLGRLLS